MSPWFSLCLVTLALHAVPTAAPVVTSNRDHLYGLNLKSIDFEAQPPANDTGETDVYSDLKYLHTNNTSLVPKTGESVASTVHHLKRGTIVPSAKPCPDAISGNCTKFLGSTPRTFDMLNQLLGVISLVEILMLCLLLLIARWDTLVALLTFNRKALCKLNLDEIGNPKGPGSAGGLMQGNLELLTKRMNFIQGPPPAEDKDESAVEKAAGNNSQQKPPVDSSGKMHSECRSETPIAAAKPDKSTAETTPNSEESRDLQKSVSSSSTSTSASPSPRSLTATMDYGPLNLLHFAGPIAIKAF